MDENNNNQQPQYQEPVYQQPDPQQYQQPNGQPPYGQPPYGQGYPVYQQYDESGFFAENKLARQNGLSARVTLGDWLKIDCIGLLGVVVPGLGSLAAIIIYCIMAFGSKTAVSVRSRIIADLIWSGIGLVISIIMIVVILAAVGPSFSKYRGWWS